MNTNHEMNYYNYGKTLDAQGVMPVINGGGGVNPGPEDEHESVDLGLSVLWATCNIGANSPEEAGLYFAWGETQGYTVEQVTAGERAFNEESYQYEIPSEIPSTLNSEHDAAIVNWGDGWRMPTPDELGTLADYQNKIYDNERNGWSFKDENDNELLFLPKLNYFEDNVLDSNYSMYWSNSTDDDKGYIVTLSVDESTIRTNGNVADGFDGCTIRPVKDK